jgi:hypothetical protein
LETPMLPAAFSNRKRILEPGERYICVIPAGYIADYDLS